MWNLTHIRWLLLNGNDTPLRKSISWSSRYKSALKSQKHGQRLLKVFLQANKKSKHNAIFGYQASGIFFFKSFDDLLFNTILALGFNGLHRIGELVEPDCIGLRDDRKLIKRWTVTIEGVNKYARYMLPYIKTDVSFPGASVIIPSRPESYACALKCLILFLIMWDKAFSPHLLLLFCANGYTPTRTCFTKRLIQVFEKERSGRSVRAGGATAYAKSGVCMGVIQRMCLRQSDTFESYVQGHPLLDLLAAQQ